MIMLPMPSLRKTIRLLLLGDFFLLPFAHLKLSLLGLPFYALELPILLAFSLFLFERVCSRFSSRPLFFPHRLVLFGTFLFLFGALLSFVTNPFSWTGLGMLKSWFLMPLTAAFLWLQTNENKAGDLFKAWGLSTLFIALGSLWFLSHGILTYDHRLEAWYASPNFLAILIAPGIIFVFFFLESLHSQKRLLSLSAFLLLLSLFIFFIVLFFTHSYTVWITTFFSLLFFLLPCIAKKNIFKKLLFVALLLMSTGVFIFFESGTEKWHSLISFEERSSLSSRMMIWQTAGKMIADSPLTGIGVGRFQEEYLDYQKYFPPYLEWAVPQPHNLFLALWLETGLIGLLGSILLIGYLCLALYRNFSLEQADENKKMSSWLILSLIFLFLFYGLTDTPYFKNDLAFIFWMLLALGTASIDRCGKDVS